MSVGGVGYSSGTLYSSGSLYKRHGIRSVQQQGNLQKMNREAASGYNASFVSGGSVMFDAYFTESQGKSELVAEQLLKRVQAAAQALSQNASRINIGSLVNGTA
jgi:hypothetical protein